MKTILSSLLLANLLTTQAQAFTISPSLSHVNLKLNAKGFELPPEALGSDATYETEVKGTQQSGQALGLESSIRLFPELNLIAQVKFAGLDGQATDGTYTSLATLASYDFYSSPSMKIYGLGGLSYNRYDLGIDTSFDDVSSEDGLVHFEAVPLSTLNYNLGAGVTIPAGKGLSFGLEYQVSDTVQPLNQTVMTMHVQASRYRREPVEAKFAYKGLRFRTDEVRLSVNFEL